MDDRTLTALKASIAEWRKKVAAETPEDVKLGVTYCALCKLFVTDGCNGCPVQHDTGQDFCEGSPYQDAVRALWKWRDSTGSREEWRAASQAMLDFLIALLPEGETA